MIREITLISAKNKFPDSIPRRIIAENGLPLVGTILKNHGYDVQVFMERIAPIRWERVWESDLVGFSTKTPTANRTYALADQIKAKKQIPIVFGGDHASMIPEDCLNHCDYVVRGEGEETIVDLLNCINSGIDPSSVLGISYKRNRKVVHNPDRPYLKNLDTITDLSIVQGYSSL